MKEQKVIECKSEEGITIGLIDSIITMARILKRRKLSTKGVKEALKDLIADEDFNSLTDKAKYLCSGNVTTYLIPKNVKPHSQVRNMPKRERFLAE